MNTLAIDREYLVKTLADLVHIDSTNPSLVSGGAGEAKIADYIDESLGNIGLAVSVHETKPGRISVVAKLRGMGGGRSLMLNAHTDTVGVEGMSNPFSADIRAGKMYGRGTYDMKGSLASCMAAAKALCDAGTSLRGDLLVAAVADEEHASIGTVDLIQRYRVDAAIVTEPTDLDICLAHKGFVWTEVETVGRAAHGSRFEEGIDANMLMGRFLGQLDKLERDLRGRKGHPLAGVPSLHAAKIKGGTDWSTYADRCKLQIERRTIPGERESQVAQEIQDIIDLLTSTDPDFRATAKCVFVRNPFVISPDAAIAKTIEKVAAQVLDRSPAFIGQTFWTDAGLLAAAGVETVVFGPVGSGLHAHEEWVDLKSLVDLSQILVQTALNYCQ